MYMYIICIHICMYIYICVHVFACMFVLGVCTYIHTYTFIDICKSRAHMYICKLAYHKF